MPALKNPKHELFAQHWASGKTEIEAYELAGYKPDAANANKLTRNNQILARVREIQAKFEKRVEFTKADMVREFDENRTIAIAKEQMAAANAASATKAKVLGFVVEKFKDVTDLDGMNADELAAERARNDAEIAELREALDEAGAGREGRTTH